MVKISIIMPVYNASEFLHKSIESVSKQTFKDFELICVDDGSTDDSLDVLNELNEKYGFIKILTQKNQGPGKARNNGIDNAQGDYIAFLDADDIYVDENSLYEMYKLTEENDDVNIISANLAFVDLDYNLKENPHYDNGDYLKCEYGKIESKDYGIPYAFYKNIFKKEFLDSHNIRFPNLITGEDPIFMAKALINSPIVYTVPLFLYGYNHSVGGGVNVKIDTYEKKFDYIQHFKDTYDILLKGGMNDLADFYKIHLFRFLTWDANMFDVEIFEIFNEIWDINNETFDESDFNYTRFIIPAKVYFLNKFDSQEFFVKVNKQFLQINIYDTFAINEKIIDYYFLVIYSNSFDEFKSNYDKYMANNLKFMKELMEFEVKKFIFNLTYYNTNNVYHNAKMVISNSPVWKSNSLSKNILKKCYELIYSED